MAPELDLIEEGDQITHRVSLDDTIDKQEHLDVFHADDNYLENEATWSKIKAALLGEESDSESYESESEEEEEDEEDEEEDEEKKKEKEVLIEDQTEQDVLNLRRTVHAILAFHPVDLPGHYLQSGL